MLRNKLTLFFVLFLTPLLLTACRPPRPAALSEDEVRAVTASLLTALEQGDYARFQAYLSEEMMRALPEEQFYLLQQDILNASGRFIQTGEMRLSNRGEYAIYRMMCQYEKEKVVVTIVFKINGTQVEGLFFDSVNLRQIPS